MKILFLITLMSSPILEHGAWRPRNLRVGEAVNPGPGPGHGAMRGDVVERIGGSSAIKRVESCSGAAVQYPQPHRDGFDDMFLLGHCPPPRPAPPDDQFALQLESFNGTGWKQLRKRLLATSAHAVLAQQTWLPQAAIPAASRWAARHGWKAVWAPAGKGARGGASGGVAILARSWLGLGYPPVGSYIWHPTRAPGAGWG